MIDPEVRDIVEKHLEDGENLLWAQRARGVIVSRIGVLFLLIVIGLYWLWYNIGVANGGFHNYLLKDYITVSVIGLVVIGFCLRFIFSPYFQINVLTDQKIAVYCHFVFRSGTEFKFFDNVKIRRANWAGKNCILMYQTWRKRQWLSVSFGVEGWVMNGVTYREDFIRHFNRAKYSLKHEQNSSEPNTVYAPEKATTIILKEKPHE